MNRTEVYIMLAGAGTRYIFNTPKAEFLDSWEVQTRLTGCFKGEDIQGTDVIIYPSQCGVIEIKACH